MPDPEQPSSALQPVVEAPVAVAEPASPPAAQAVIGGDPGPANEGSAPDAGYDPPPPPNDPARSASLPELGIHVAPDADGITAVHAIDATGTEHVITIASNHGMLAAFKTSIMDLLHRLGERATSWEKL